jgi:nitroreductase
MDIIHENIENAIHDSQLCQRNWDLSKEIPQADLDLILTSVTQCPSKQNIAHYKIHAITNRDIIEAIHSNTVGFAVTYEPYVAETNSQVLANLLLVFEEHEVNIEGDTISSRNDETRMLQQGTLTEAAEALLLRDRYMAVGIAVGYCHMTASLLGYSTGCCACFDSKSIQEILGIKGQVLLMTGVGYKDPSLDRRMHHKNHSFTFPAKTKQEISITWHK